MGWNLTDGRSVHFEYTLDDGTRADYVLSDRDGRSMAVVEAKKACINPVEAEGQVGDVLTWGPRQTCVTIEGRWSFEDELQVE